mgnify:CR=1 FL=1
MYNQDSKIIAVDFDGTIVEDQYPKIGKPMIFAFETLKMLQGDGHRLILWTYRYGRKLKEAVDFCRENGLEFYAVNRSYPEEEYDEAKASRKIHADIFIDDRNLGGMKGWGEIYQEISGKTPPEAGKKKKRRGLFGLG